MIVRDPNSRPVSRAQVRLIEELLDTLGYDPRGCAWRDMANECLDRTVEEHEDVEDLTIGDASIFIEYLKAEVEEQELF